MYSLAGVPCTPHLCHRGQTSAYTTITGVFYASVLLPILQSVSCSALRVLRTPWACWPQGYRGLLRRGGDWCGQWARHAARWQASALPLFLHASAHCVLDFSPQVTPKTSHLRTCRGILHDLPQAHIAYDTGATLSMGILRGAPAPSPCLSPRSAACCTSAHGRSPASRRCCHTDRCTRSRGDGWRMASEERPW